MQIDRNLNLLIPVERDDGKGMAYVHVTPLSVEVFESYFMTLSKAFATLWNEGVQTLVGPRVAALVLRKIAEDEGTWSGDRGVESGVVNEMRRLMNVAVVDGERGWVSLPYSTAVKRGLLSSEEASEVEGIATFFTLVSLVPPRNQRRLFLAGFQLLWGLQTTCSTCTEYANSLKTPTTDDATGESETLSSVPH